jgi:hypothetical protein
MGQIYKQNYYLQPPPKKKLGMWIKKYLSGFVFFINTLIITDSIPFFKKSAMKTKIGSAEITEFCLDCNMTFQTKYNQRPRVN